MGKGIYLAVGLGVGTAVGVATDNLGLWLSVGIAIGAAMSLTVGRSDNGDKETTGSDEGGDQD